MKITVKIPSLFDNSPPKYSCTSLIRIGIWNIEALAFAICVSYSLPNIIILILDKLYLASGSFVVPDIVTSLRVLAVGGGGGGGCYHYGGGGSGMIASGTFAVTPGTNYSVVVGKGGNGRVISSH